MKAREFEQKLQFFTRNTLEEINPANLAYYMKIEIKEAKQLLEDIMSSNIVVYDDDAIEDGKLIYKMPGVPRRDNPEEMKKYFFPEIIEQKGGVRRQAYFIGKKRSFFLVILFSMFIPFYGLYYFYSIWDEAHRHSKKVKFGGGTAILLSFIPFINLWIMYETAHNVVKLEEEDNFNDRTFSSVSIIFLMLTSIFIIPLFILLAKINDGMNRHWDYHILNS